MDAFDHDRWIETLQRSTERPHVFDSEQVTDVGDWQTAFRRDLRETLGLSPADNGDPPALAPRQHGTETADGHERQTWSVRTDPGVRVPLSILLPGDVEPPYPVVLALHGHTEHGMALPTGAIDPETPAIAEERRDIARQAVDRGYAAIAPTVRGFGALGGDGWRNDRWACGRLQLYGQLFGRTLLGDRVRDVQCILDFVQAQPRFQSRQIAVAGHSGGGAVALFAAALDERLSPVVVSAYFCPFEDSILAGDHCPCNYVPGLATLARVSDVAGLIAPRPFRALAGQQDDLFPIDGARTAMSRLEAIYAAAGVPDRCDLHAGAGGHQFYPSGAWPFIERHFG